MMNRSASYIHHQVMNESPFRLAIRNTMTRSRATAGGQAGRRLVYTGRSNGVLPGRW
jgi:hypothetical protein